jgi:hypothetical protein
MSNGQYSDIDSIPFSLRTPKEGGDGYIVVFPPKLGWDIKTK